MLNSFKIRQVLLLILAVIVVVLITTVAFNYSSIRDVEDASKKQSQEILPNLFDFQ